MNSQSVYQPPQQQFNNFDPNIDFQNLTNSNNHCGASSQNTFLSDLSNPYVPPTQQMNHHPPLQQPYNPFSPPQPAGPGLDQVLTRPNERELAELLQEWFLTPTQFITAYTISYKSYKGSSGHEYEQLKYSWFSLRVAYPVAVLLSSLSFFFTIWIINYDSYYLLKWHCSLMNAPYLTSYILCLERQS